MYNPLDGWWVSLANYDGLKEAISIKNAKHQSPPWGPEDGRSISRIYAQNHFCSFLTKLYSMAILTKVSNDM